MLKLAGLTVAIVLVATVGWSDAQTNSLRICNTGNTTFWVAVVEMYEGGLLMSDRFHGEGWWEVTAGGCKNVFQRAYFNIRVAFVAFAYVDRWGTAGVAHVTPAEPGPFATRTNDFDESDRVFCSMSGDFHFKSVELSETKNCPEIGSPTPKFDAAGNAIFRMPYTLAFTPGRGVSATFNASVDPNTPVWRPFPARRDRAAPLPETAAPPIPVAPSRPVVPKPFQPGTATATFLGKTIARWRAEGDGQWFHEDGTAAQGIKDGPYDNLGLFDWPSVYASLPEHVDGLLRSLHSSETQDIRLGTDGRLYIYSPDRTAFDTTSLQSLDVQNAKYYLGFLNIPCRKGHRQCVYGNGLGLSGTLRISVDNAAAVETALGGMRQLKELFGNPTRVVREDADCSCLRYDVGIALVQADVPSSPAASQATATRFPQGAAIAVDKESTVNPGNRASEAVSDKRAAGWFIAVLILACGVLVALRSRVKSGSSM
jgi:hypothetical protein